MFLTVLRIRIRMDPHSKHRLDPDPQQNADPDPAGKIWQYFYNILSQLTKFFYRYLLFSTKKYRYGQVPTY